MKFMEAADEEVSDKTVEQARVVAEQDTKPVAQVLAGFVRDECKVRGHD
jgi:hypothetical protein